MADPWAMTVFYVLLMAHVAMYFIYRQDLGSCDNTFSCAFAALVLIFNIASIAGFLFLTVVAAFC